MIPSSDQLFGDQDFTLLHDRVPDKIAKFIKKWFEDCGIILFPANSKDLSVRKFEGNHEEEVAEISLQQSEAVKGFHWEGSITTDNCG